MLHAIFRVGSHLILYINVYKPIPFLKTNIVFFAQLLYYANTKHVDVRVGLTPIKWQWL